MRFACLLIVLAACGGPIRQPYATPSRAPDEPDPRVLRPPANAPPDPIGTTRPGNRSCSENRDCKTGETCFAPDYVPAGSRGSGATPAGGMVQGAMSPNGASPGIAPAPGIPPSGAPGIAASGMSPNGGSPGIAPGGAPSGARPAGAPGGMPPGGVPPGGVPPPHGTAPAGTAAQCLGDAQCSPGLICAAGACVAPCSQGSCPLGLECRAGGRCMPIPCNGPQAAVCPQNHRCNGSSGACERQACTSRAQCDSGVCFQGRCFAHDAYCLPQNSTFAQ